MGVPRIFQTNLVQTGLECDDFNIFIKIFAFAYSENHIIVVVMLYNVIRYKLFSL